MIYIWEYVLIVILITIPLLIDIFRLKWKKRIKKHSLTFLIKLFFVIFEYISIKFGLNILFCISNLETEICSSSELNLLVFGIGIGFILIGSLGYFYTLVNLNLEGI